MAAAGSWSAREMAGVQAIDVCSEFVLNVSGWFGESWQWGGQGIHPTSDRATLLE